MVVGTHIAKHAKMSSKKELFFYNKPKIVYIPLICGNDTNVTVLVKKGDYVLKGTPVAHRKGNMKLPLFASVSGNVLGIEEKTVYSGEQVKCLVIENDFKEKTGEKVGEKNIHHYTKEEFIDTLKNCGIKGMGGADFPTYIKYATDKKIETLLVNAVECEPYITADYKLLQLKYQEILEAIDAILEINHIPEAIIAIKRGNQEIKKLLDDFIGTYVRIHIVEVPNVYPMGWEKNLVNYVKKVDYERLPIEKNIVVNNVSTIYAIYTALKYHKPLMERIVTFTGEMLKNPQNVMVKIGTPVSEVIENIGGFQTGDITFVAGGPMMGVALPSEELIITSNLNCVLVLKETSFPTAIECLRCGKCVEACPAKLSPVLIKDNLENLDRLEQLHSEKCCGCGLCSYVCPSKILVRNFVKQANQNRLERSQS